MGHTTLKRVALAGLLAAAWSLPARAQQANQVQAIQIQSGQITLTAEGEATQAQPAPVTQVRPLTLGGGTLRFESSAPSPYWIGVEAQPLDEAMRTALELTEKHGILVARVTEDSPAEKAGLKAGDILLQWVDAEKKGQPIESVEHLVKLVQDAAAKQADQAVTIEFRRRGKTDTVELKPAKRFEGAGQNFIFKNDNIGPNEHVRHQLSALEQQLKMLVSQRDEAKKKLEAANAKTSRSGPVNKEDVANATKAEVQYKMLEAQVQQAEAHLRQFEVWTKAMSAHGFAVAAPGTANFDVLIPAPGFVTRATAPGHAQGMVQGQAQMKPVEWPEDLSVTMKRKGNKPAEFVVQRGEEKWEVTADGLKDLPQDLRAIVEPLAEPQKSRMMRLWSSQGNDMPGRVELRVPEGERPPVPGLPIAPPRVVIHATPQIATVPAPAATQKQIEELQKALEQLRKQVELMEKK